MYKIILIALAVIALTSCKETDTVYNPDSVQDAEALTKQSFASPKIVGTLPDGRVVKMVVRSRYSQHEHYIYFVDSGEITVNTAVSQGKYVVNKAYSTIPEASVKNSSEINVINENAVCVGDLKYVCNGSIYHKE